jgi:mitogen-activated protein kinase kinase kinase 13
MHSCSENYEEKQKTWQKEVAEKLQTSANNGTKIYEVERDLIRKRQDEWKHAKDVRLIYERKLERTNNLYIELSACFVQLEERERDIAEREKQLGTSKPYKKAISQLKKQHFDKISRRRLYIQPIQTASEVNSGTSPSPPTSPISKANLCVQVDGSSTKTVLHPPSSNGPCFPLPPPKYIPRKIHRHRRTGSGSSITKFSSREVKLVHSETQTEDINKVGNDSSSAEKPPTPKKEVTFKHSKAILQSSESSSGDTDIDDHAPEDDTTSSSQNNPMAMINSMATSVMTCSNFSYEEENYGKECSDDDLENLSQKVNNLITDTSNSTTSSASTIVNKAYTVKPSDAAKFSSKYDENMNDDKNVSDTHDEISTDDTYNRTPYHADYALNLNTKDISNFLRRKR